VVNDLTQFIEQTHLSKRPDIILERCGNVLERPDKVLERCGNVWKRSDIHPKRQGGRFKRFFGRNSDIARLLKPASEAS